MIITTGFLSGNLATDFEPTNEQIQQYARMVREEIARCYPGAEVEVDWQDASGALPEPLRTYVDIGVDEVIDEDAIEREVFEIRNSVWEKWLQQLPPQPQEE